MLLPLVYCWPMAACRLSTTLASLKPYQAQPKTMTKHRHFSPVIVLLLLIFSLISSAHLSQPLRAKQAQQAHWQSLQALLPSSMQHKALSFEQRQLSGDKAISSYYAVKQHDITTAWIIPVRVQGFADTIE